MFMKELKEFGLYRILEMCTKIKHLPIKDQLRDIHVYIYKVNYFFN
jgi:hypothetical protein